MTNYIYNNIKIAYEICKTWIFNTKKEQEAYDQPTLCNEDETYEIVEANAEYDFSALRLIGMFCITEAGVMLLLLVLLFENYFSKIINQFLTTAQ